MLLLFALFAVIAAAAAAAALLCHHRRRLADRGTQALLASAPVALWRHRRGKAVFLPGPLEGLRPAGPSSAEDLVGGFLSADGPAVSAALQALLAEGRSFALTARLASGGPVELLGRRLALSGEDVVWITPVAAREEARAAAEAAAATASSLRAMLDAVPVPVWRRDAELRLRDCNAAYAAALGAPREAVLRDGLELAEGGARDGGSVALARSALDAGAPRRARRPTVMAGARRLLEITEAPDGAAGAVGHAVDLTDIENARADLDRHVAAHAETIQHITTGIAVYGSDTRLKFFNAAFAELWRLDLQWLATRPTCDEIMERLRELRRLPEHADYRAYREEMRKLFTTALPEPLEELLHLPDGRTLRRVVSAYPLGGLTYSYEDFSDKLALERSYNTLIEVQRETLDNLYEGIAVFGTDGRLKLWNPAFARIWNLAPEDLVGEPHVAKITDRSRPYFDTGADWPTLRERIIGAVTSAVMDSRQLDRRDGSVLRTAIVPLPDGNVLLSFLDVTDSERVQRALTERNAALETADRLKSEFIANVSYELRTPLNAIIGFAEILTNQYFGDLNPRQLDYSRGILESSHRLLSLINDILDLATIEAGYMVLETEQVDIHGLLASVLALSRERARRRQLTLEFDCPPDIGVLIADERRLKQALFNLLSNAIKFTLSGGTIRLSARRSGAEVALVVSDTGIGIAREDQRRVFDKFERAHPDAGQSGAGLGLSLVKSFIELHGGRVVLESEAGMGTTVTCWLPAEVPASPPATEPAKVPVTVRQPA